MKNKIISLNGFLIKKKNEERFIEVSGDWTSRLAHAITYKTRTGAEKFVQTLVCYNYNQAEIEVVEVKDFFKTVVMTDENGMKKKEFVLISEDMNELVKTRLNDLKYECKCNKREIAYQERKLKSMKLKQIKLEKSVIEYKERLNKNKR